MPNDPGEKPKEDADILTAPEAPKSGGFKKMFEAIRGTLKSRITWAIIGVILGGGAVSVQQCGTGSCGGGSGQADIEKPETTKPHNDIFVPITLSYDAKTRSMNPIRSVVQMHMDDCGDSHSGKVSSYGGTIQEYGGTMSQDIRVIFTAHEKDVCYQGPVKAKRIKFTDTSTQGGKYAKLVQHGEYVPNDVDYPWVDADVPLKAHLQPRCD